MDDERTTVEIPTSLIDELAEWGAKMEDYESDDAYGDSMELAA